MEYVFNLTDKVLAGHKVTREEAEYLMRLKGADLMDLYACANKIRERFHGNKVDLCSVINAKSGDCAEDCRFCAQSVKHDALIEEYPLMEKAEILRVAENALENGAKRFCVSTSGKKLSPAEVDSICETVLTLKSSLPIYCCATLGELSTEHLSALKEAGLDRYHHNIETSRNHFPNICTTHSYEVRLRTIFNAKEAGLSLCVGFIVGMGENKSDWIDMVMSVVGDIDADSIPINFLMPIQGTPMEEQESIKPGDALKFIALTRFLNPDKEIRVCGGRLAALQDLHSFIFFAGADGMMIGNYLTRIGRDPKKDLTMINHLNMDTEDIIF